MKSRTHMDDMIPFKTASIIRSTVSQRSLKSHSWSRLEGLWSVTDLLSLLDGEALEVHVVWELDMRDTNFWMVLREGALMRELRRLWYFWNKLSTWVRSDHQCVLSLSDGTELVVFGLLYRLLTSKFFRVFLHSRGSDGSSWKTRSMTKSTWMQNVPRPQLHVCST